MRAARARRADLVGDCKGLPGCAEGECGEAGDDSRWRLRILAVSSEGRAERGAGAGSEDGGGSVATSPALDAMYTALLA